MAVFATLSTGHPLTMQQLILQCAELDRSSVYRTIAVFERVAIVHKVYTGWKYRIELSDTFHDHHHHATCIRCDKTITLAEDNRIEELMARLARTADFIMTRHELELQGICHSCKSPQDIA